MAAFEKQAREVVLGGVIIIALVLFAFGVFFLEPFVASLRDLDEVIAVLPEAPKLTAGAEVWIAGRHVGQVTRVSFMPFRGDSLARIAVTMEFPHSVYELVREDSHIRLTSARIIGAPVIDITPGTAASPLIGPGDTLYMDKLVTLVSLHEQATITVAALQQTLVEVGKLSGPAKARMASLAPVMQNMSAAQSQLTALMNTFHSGAAGRFMSDGAFMAELASLQKTAAALGPAFASAQANMSRATGPAGKSLAQLQANAARMSAAIDQLQQMMVNNNGTFFRATADSALLKALHATKAQLDSLIIEAKKNPLKFVM